jgi:hypothetical protein
MSANMFHAEKNVFFSRVQDGFQTQVRVVKLKRWPGIKKWPVADQKFKRSEVVFDFTLDATVWRELNQYLTSDRSGAAIDRLHHPRP